MRSYRTTLLWLTVLLLGLALMAPLTVGAAALENGHRWQPDVRRRTLGAIRRRDPHIDSGARDRAAARPGGRAHERR